MDSSTSRKPDPKSPLVKAMNARTSSLVVPAKWPDSIRPLSNPDQHAAAVERFMAYYEIRQPKDWKKWDIPLIAELAKIDIICEAELDRVVDEGSSLTSDKGGAYLNPALTAYSRFFQNRMVLMGKLGLLITDNAAAAIGNYREEARKLDDASKNGSGLLA